MLGLQNHVRTDAPTAAEWSGREGESFWAARDNGGRHELRQNWGKGAEADDEPPSTHDLRFDQGDSDNSAAHPQTACDRADRNATQMQPHGFSRFLDAHAGSTSGDIGSSQVCRHRGSMHAIPIRQVIDTRPGAVVVHEAIHLGGSERSSKICSPPPPHVRESPESSRSPASVRPGRHPLPPCDQGV